nr:MFS transporter [Patulibacter sp. SYSU D01012]
MNGLDSTIVGPALPAIGAGLGTDAGATSLVESAFLVASAVVLPAAGWVGDRFGAFRVFVVGLLVFSLASAVAALAGSLAVLGVARAVQGAASGVLTPVGLALLYRGSTPADRLRIARWTTIPLTVAPMLGPVLGGVLAEHAGWRWVFAVTVPFGLLAAGLAVVVLGGRREEHAGEDRPLDVRGLALAAGGVGTVVSGLTIGLHRGWDAPSAWVAGAVGVLLCAGAVWAARRTDHPVLDLDLWRDPHFRRAGATVAWSSAALMGLLYLVPLMLQQGYGASPTAAGAAVFPETVGLLVGSQLVERLVGRVGARRLVLGGLAGAAGAFVLVAAAAPSLGPVGVGAAMFLMGLCLSQAVLVGQAASFTTVQERATTDATALFMAQRTLAGALGVVAAAALLGVLVDAAGATGDGYRLTVLAMLAFLALAAAATARLSRGALQAGFDADGGAA